jgi:hypothetical protein
VFTEQARSARLRAANGQHSGAVGAYVATGERPAKWTVALRKTTARCCWENERLHRQRMTFGQLASVRLCGALARIPRPVASESVRASISETVLSSSLATQTAERDGEPAPAVCGLGGTQSSRRTADVYEMTRWPAEPRRSEPNEGTRKVALLSPAGGQCSSTGLRSAPAAAGGRGGFAAGVERADSLR